MSGRTTDRRIIRTKQMIRDGLTELMEEKGFEGITINELTAKAGINRGTFYLHYHDKHDLLEHSEAEIIQEINEIILAAQQLAPQNIFYYNHPPEKFPFVVKLFEYLLENSGFMKVILGPKGDPSFQEKLKEVLSKNMFQYFIKIVPKEETLVPLEYLIAYISSAHLGVIQHWLESGMENSPEDMALVLSKMTHFCIGYAARFIKFPQLNT